MKPPAQKTWSFWNTAIIAAVIIRGGRPQKVLAATPPTRVDVQAT